MNPPWDYEVIEKMAGEVVQALKGLGVEHIKIYDRLSPDAFGWIMDEAESVGLDAWGHVPLRISSTKASDAGFRSVEHARDLLFA